MLIEFYIAVTDAVYVFISHLRNSLSRFVHEVMFDEPLANKFFGELFLCFSVSEFLFVTISIKIAAAVWCVDFINQIYLSVTFAEFIFCIDENQSLFGCDFGTSFEYLARVLLHLFIIFFVNDALFDNILFGYVQIMTFISFCGGSDDGFGKTLILFHSVRQFNTAQFSASVFVFTPS